MFQHTPHTHRAFENNKKTSVFLPSEHAFVVNEIRLEAELLQRVTMAAPPTSTLNCKFQWFETVLMQSIAEATQEWSMVVGSTEKPA